MSLVTTRKTTMVMRKIEIIMKKGTREAHTTRTVTMVIVMMEKGMDFVIRESVRKPEEKLT